MGTVTEHIADEPVADQIRIIAEYLDHTEEMILKVMENMERLGDVVEKLMNRVG